MRSCMAVTVSEISPPTPANKSTALIIAAVIPLKSKVRLTTSVVSLMISIVELTGSTISATAEAVSIIGSNDEDTTLIRDEQDSIQR